MKRVFAFLAFGGILLGQGLVVTGPRVDNSQNSHVLPIPLVATTATLPTLGCIPGEMIFVIGSNSIYENSTTGGCTWQSISTGTGGGLADPGANGIITRTSLNVTAPATSANVVQLFTGCSGANYLGADGACHVPGGGGLADPGANGLITRTALNVTAPATASNVIALFGSCTGVQYLGADSACHTPGGSSTGGSFITTAGASPQTILAATHQQGVNASVLCYSGPVSGAATTGSSVLCNYSKNASGDVIVSWGASTVGSIQIFSSGVGPAGTPGAPGGIGPAGPINTVLSNGTPQTVRPKVNFASGTNVTISASDNGVDTTTITVASTGGGGGSPAGVTGDLQINSAGLFGAVHPASGVAGFPRWNGTTWSVGNIPVGSSGGLDCASVPAQCDIVTSVIPRFTFPWIQTGAVNFLGSSVTAPNRSGTGSPNARDNCANVGETYFQTDATPGSNNWACTTPGSPGVWTLQGTGGGGGGSVLPYVTNATTSPQTITELTHLQGINPSVQCWSGALSSGATTGNLVLCAVSKNAAGDVTITWSGSLGSIEVMAAGPGPSTGGGTVTSVTPSSPITGGGTTVVTLACPTCVVAGSSLTSGRLVFGGGSQAAGVGDLSGAVTTAGSNITTIASVNGSPGVCGDATHVCQITTNGPGQVVTQAAVAISGGGGGGGTVTSVATVGPITGGTFTTSGVISCPTCATIGTPSGSTGIMSSAGGNAIGVNTAISVDTAGDMLANGSITTLAFLNAGKGIVLPQGADPGSAGAGAFQLIAPVSISSSYRWKVPGADAAGVIASDGAGTPGTLSIIPTVGTGSIVRASAAITTINTTSPLSGGPITGGTGTVSCPTCVVSGAALTSGQLVFGGGGQNAATGNLSGDASTSGSVVTLATVNGSPGTCGDATHVCQVTVNGKGLTTSQTAIAITGGGGGSPGGSSGQSQYNNSGSFGGYTMSGDATLNTATGALTLASANTTGAGTCGDVLTNCSATLDAKGRVVSWATIRRSGSFDIRNSGAVCNNTNQHTALLSTLNSGNTNLWFPKNCIWVLPNTSWTYNPGTGTITVPANTVPAGLIITGEDWNLSAIKVASPSSVDLQVGAQTTIYSMSLVGHGCDFNTVPGGDPCPNSFYNNADTVLPHHFFSDSWQAITLDSSAQTDQAPFQCRQYGSGDCVLAGATFSGTAVRAAANNVNNSVVTTGSGCGTGTDVCWVSGTDFRRFHDLPAIPLGPIYIGPGCDGSGGACVRYMMAAWVSNTHLTITTSAGNNSSVPASLSDGGQTIFMAQRANHADGFLVVDSPAGGINCANAANPNAKTYTCASDGIWYEGISTVKATGEMIHFTQQTSAYSGTAILLDMAQATTGGTFTGYFEIYTNQGVPKWTLSNSGDAVSSGLLTGNGGVQSKVTAVSGLPTCTGGLEGTYRGVNDALAPTFGATVVGGGSVHVPVYCNSSAWIIF